MATDHPGPRGSRVYDMSGCEGGESMRDPWFESDEEAETWEAPEGFDSETREG
jgi:hypothetical protein